MSGEAKILIGVSIVTIVMVIGAALLLGGVSSRNTTTEEKVILTSEQQKSLAKEDSQKITVPNAKVTIVEFIDYECEACGAAHPIVKQILEEYKGKVNFVVRNFPNHNNSVLAANIVEAAGEQGKYWEMHNKLLESQQEWGEKKEPQTELFLKYAQELNLDIDKVRASLESNKFTTKINKDKEEGIAIGVNATPTFFINGEMQVGGLPYDEFKQKIEEKLRN